MPANTGGMGSILHKFEISFINTQAWGKLLVYHTVGRSPEGQSSLNSSCQSGSFTCMSQQAFEFSQEKQGISKGTEGTCKGTPGQIPTSGGSDPHPQTAGSGESPPSRPCTRSSGQGPGIPTPQEWNLWTHPWRSIVPEMKTDFTKGPWGGFLVSHKMRRGERGKAQFTWSNILSDRSIKSCLKQTVGL